MFQKKCGTCRLYIPQRKTCQLMIAQMEHKIEPTDYCSKHNDHLPICESCGAGLLESYVEVIDGNAHIFCAQCIQRIR